MRAATTRQIKATSTDRTLFAATTTKADSINSYAPTIGKDDLHQGAVPPGITMLTLKDMTSSRYAAHNEDLGVIRIAQPKHTMPMTDAVRWLIILLAIATAAMTSGIILLAKGRPPLIPRYNEASLCLLTADKR